MNIPDIGGTGAAADNVRHDIEIQRPEQTQPENIVENRLRPETSENNELLSQQKDEYIRSLSNIVKGTMYDVTDVRVEKIKKIRTMIQESRYNPNGKEVAEKVVDILLPMGIKTLSIYTKTQEE